MINNYFKILKINKIKIPNCNIIRFKTKKEFQINNPNNLRLSLKRRINNNPGKLIQKFS